MSLSITQQTFLGASISNFNAGLGWDNDNGTLTVLLVEDPDNGDSFRQPFTGQFVYFRYNEWVFNGIIQSFNEDNSIQGKPTYRVVISDGREMLAGVQLILGEYTGPVRGIPNIVNLYGYLESTGFGNSLVNEGGMPWATLTAAFNNLVGTSSQIFTNNTLNINNPNIQYTNGLTYRGQIFYVDLSQLPNMPADYRINSSSLSLLDLISQVCQDSSRNFFIKTVESALGPILTVTTVARQFQPPLDAISRFLLANPEAVSNSRGQELRHDTTSVFLTGGHKQILQIVEASGNSPETCGIWPYWGLDAAGNVIIGRSYDVYEYSTLPVSPTFFPNYYSGKWFWPRAGWQSADTTIIWRKAYTDYFQRERTISRNAQLQREAIELLPRNQQTAALNELNALVDSELSRSMSIFRSIVPAPLVPTDGANDRNTYRFPGFSALSDSASVNNMLTARNDRHGFFMDIYPFDNPTSLPGVTQDLKTWYGDTFVAPFFNNDYTRMGGHLLYNDIGIMRAAIAGEDEWGSMMGQFDDTYQPYFRFSYYVDPAILAKLADVARLMAVAPVGRKPGDIPGVGGLLQDIQIKLGTADKNSDQVDQLANELYEYYHMYATKFYGTQYMVRIPYPIVSKRDPESNIVTTNIEIADGGYLPEGSSPLGINQYDVDRFSSTNGLYQPFVKFNSASGLDFSSLSADSYSLAADSSVLYVKCDVDPQFVYGNWRYGSDPRAVIKLPGPVYQKHPTDEDINPLYLLVLKLLQANNNILNDRERIALKTVIKDALFSPGTTNILTGFSKRAVMPDAVAIALKSNVDTYGPWYIVGADGFTRFEHDESLVPWNYGGYDGLNRNANAKLIENFSFMQASELGQITLPGTPDIGLGNELTAGGPIVTNINVEVGPQGVETTYTMRTYSPKFGHLTKQINDKYNRLNVALSQQRRDLRKLYKDLSSPTFAFNTFGKTTDEITLFSDFRGRRDTRSSRSPHEMIFMQAANDINRRDLNVSLPNDPSGYIKKYKGSFETYNNITSYFTSDPSKPNPNDQLKVGVSLDQLFIPFMPTGIFENLRPDIASFFPRTYASGFVLQDYQPYWPPMYPDVQIATGILGEQYTSYRLVPKSDWIRPSHKLNYGLLALRTPLFLAGPGYTNQGRFFTEASGTTDLEEPRRWRVGPLNVQWDEITQSWMSATKPQPTLIIGIFKGKVSHEITAPSFDSTAYVAEVNPLLLLGGIPGDARPEQQEFRPPLNIIFFNPFRHPLVLGNTVGLMVTQNGYYIAIDTEKQYSRVVTNLKVYDGNIVVEDLPMAVNIIEGAVDFPTNTYASGYLISSVSAAVMKEINYGLLGEAPLDAFNRDFRG